MNSHGEDSYPGHEILSEFDEGDVEEMWKCATSMRKSLYS
jgi:hypothetical protein